SGTGKRPHATNWLGSRPAQSSTSTALPKPPPRHIFAGSTDPTPPGAQPMKGDPQVIEALNRALTVELTAINQYFCQAKMCKNWGFLKLAAKHYHESMGEMKHAEMLIDRILFLEGTPEIARYDVIRVGTDVKEQFENDL